MGLETVEKSNLEVTADSLRKLDEAHSADGHETLGDVTAKEPVLSARKVNVYYGEKQALFDVNLDIGRNEVVALIGPSGCGKSTFIRCLNRMNDTIETARTTGNITLDGQNIYDKSMDVVLLRARVGIVFQKPNPFPKSIYENVAYGARIQFLKNYADTRTQQIRRGTWAWRQLKNPTLK